MEGKKWFRLIMGDIFITLLLNLIAYELLGEIYVEILFWGLMLLGVLAVLYFTAWIGKRLFP